MITSQYKATGSCTFVLYFEFRYTPELIALVQTFVLNQALWLMILTSRKFSYRFCSISVLKLRTELSLKVFTRRRSFPSMFMNRKQISTKRQQIVGLIDGQLTKTKFSRLVIQKFENVTLNGDPNVNPSFCIYILPSICVKGHWLVQSFDTFFTVSLLKGGGKREA